MEAYCDGSSSSAGVISRIRAVSFSRTSAVLSLVRVHSYLVFLSCNAPF